MPIHMAATGATCPFETGLAKVGSPPSDPFGLRPGKTGMGQKWPLASAGSIAAYDRERKLERPRAVLSAPGAAVA